MTSCYDFQCVLDTVEQNLVCGWQSQRQEGLISTNLAVWPFKRVNRDLTKCCTRSSPHACQLAWAATGGNMRRGKGLKPRSGGSFLLAGLCESCADLLILYYHQGKICADLLTIVAGEVVLGYTWELDRHSCPCWHWKRGCLMLNCSCAIFTKQ